MKFLLPTLALAAIGLYGCNNTNSDTEQPATELTDEATAGNEASANLRLSSNDQMQFDKNQLTVKAGQEVTLTLTHTGTMAEEVMGHNFVLLAQGTDLAQFAAEAMQAKENDYIPAGSAAVLAHTDLIGGGESTTVTFTAPEPGVYDYICSFPGHYALMKGKLIVK